jgi:UTP--glucose-1-phosphate uridylyltransferase
MGAAVEVFDGAVAIEVDRARFLPVKTTNDLLLMRSDVYGVGEDFRVRAQVDHPALINLDRRFFSTIAGFEARVPEAPSLVDAHSLTVRGDWRFGRGVVVTGDVVLEDTGVAEAVPPATRLGDS